MNTMLESAVAERNVEGWDDQALGGMVMLIDNKEVEKGDVTKQIPFHAHIRTPD